MEILGLKDVTLTYQTPERETRALENVTFSVDEGEFVSLVGPSGCGKTTILSLVAGLIAPTSGEILVGGKPVAEAGRGSVGYMLQRDHLFEWRTIRENVLLGPEIRRTRGTETEAYADALLRKYGLYEFRNHYPSQLSGGMRQRVALIRTLALHPNVLLLDEPFSALDFQTRLSVCDDVYAIIREERKTALLVTHDISEAVSMSNRVLVLSPRPAVVKRDFRVDLAASTPLGRREEAGFSAWFDRVWKEVSVHAEE